MKLLERLFHSKATPEETVVPDEYIKKYPEPSEKVQELLQRVPDTGKMLYQYIRHTSISKEWKYWAVDLLEKGIETPGIIQLAGEDLDMFPTEFAELLDTILKELDIEINQETAYCSYVMSIAQEVIRGERTARSGFEVLGRAASDIDYQEPFYNFWLWLDCADEVVYYTIKGSGLRMDNVEEWMHQFFEKLVKANPKYCSDYYLKMKGVDYQVVKFAIDEFDFYGLLKDGCPADEFDAESKAIAKRISKEDTESQIAKVIADVFNKAFDCHLQASDYIEPAKRIKSLL